MIKNNIGRFENDKGNALNMNWYKKARKEDKIGELIEELDREDKWTSVESSFITHVAYYEPLGMLELKMKNNITYPFVDVPKEVYDGFMSAPSKGKYFNDVIKQYKLK